MMNNQCRNMKNTAIWSYLEIDNSIVDIFHFQN